MSDLAAGLLAGGGGLVAFLVVVAWVIAKVSDLSSQLADSRIGLAAANSTNATNAKSLSDTQAALKRVEDQYVVAAAQISQIQRQAVSNATDADAVAMAGGDRRAAGGSPVVAGVARGDAAGDGMLMAPDWDASAPDADRVVTAPAAVLPNDGSTGAAGQVVSPVRT